MENIVEALKALRSRKVTLTRDHMPSQPTGEDRALISMVQPSLASDKKLVEAIMALGVKLYKAEHNLQD